MLSTHKNVVYFTFDIFLNKNNQIHSFELRFIKITIIDVDFFLLILYILVESKQIKKISIHLALKMKPKVIKKKWQNHNHHRIYRKITIYSKIITIFGNFIKRMLLLTHSHFTPYTSEHPILFSPLL